MTKLEAIIQQFEQALERLKDALKQEKNEFMRDSCIQRFEFTFDLAWKAMKAHLSEKDGILCSSPKKCIREAYKQGLIDYEKIWLDLTDARNLTSHSYNQETADEIYAMLPESLDHFDKLLKKLG